MKLKMMSLAPLCLLFFLGSLSESLEAAPPRKAAKRAAPRAPARAPKPMPKPKSMQANKAKPSAPEVQKVSALNDSNAHKMSPKDQMGPTMYNGVINQNQQNQKLKAAGKAPNKLPEPDTYLSDSYTKGHLKQFDDGASKVAGKASFEKYGPAQRDGTSFVSPSRDTDKMVKDANGSKSKMADSLGWEPGSKFSADGTVLKVKDPKASNLRIPSGNEAGANGEWLPGGKLPNGKSEAVVDGLTKENKDGKYQQTDVSFPND